MKILATNCYSGGGQFTEAAQRGRGLVTFCLRNNVFDTNPPEDIERLLAKIQQEGVQAVILDNHWMPSGAMSISHGEIDFARKLRELGVETFFLCKGNHRGFLCELWRAHKPGAFRDMKEPVLLIAKVGEFGDEVFRTDNSEVFFRTSGDGGDESVQHNLREGYAYRERDWPKIVKAVEEELAA